MKLFLSTNQPKGIKRKLFLDGMQMLSHIEIHQYFGSMSGSQPGGPLTQNFIEL